MSDKTYKIEDVNGNMVEISAETARTLYFALEREGHKEDVLEELSEWYDDVDKETCIDVSKVSDDLIERIVDMYEKGLENDDSWRYSLESAIDEHIDAVRDELLSGNKPKGKSADYTTRDINGNEVILSASAAREIANACDREYYKEDILIKLEAFCADEELDMDKISPDTIDAIVEEYKDSRESDESWNYHADNAIERFVDDIREECKRTDKSRSAPSAERE